MKLRELPQIMALSAEAKLDLIDEIWDSIGSGLDRVEVSDEEKKLLDERWERHLADPEAALTLEQLKVAVAARLT